MVDKMPNVQKEAQATSFISLSRLHTLTDRVFALCLVLLVIFIDRPMEDSPVPVKVLFN